MANQIVTKIIVTRTNKDILFFEDNPMWEGYVKAKYIDTGKLLSKKFVVHGDKLSGTYAMVWADNDARLEYINDPLQKANMESRRAYRQKHGMTYTWENTEWDGDTIVRQWSGGEDDAQQ